MRGAFVCYARGRFADSVSKFFISLLICSASFLDSFRVAVAEDALTADDIEFLKLVAIEGLPPHIQDAIVKYTQGSGGLTKDLIRLSNANKSLVSRILSGPAEDTSLLAGFTKKDQLQLIWAKKLADGACFEVPPEVPLYHGIAPGYDDPFGNIAHNRNVSEWPFFTSTTTNYEIALGRAEGDKSRIYQFVASQPGLKAIPVVNGMNPKGAEYETILFGTRFRGNGTRVLGISPLAVPRMTVRSVVPGPPAMMASVLNRTVPELGEAVDNTIYRIDSSFSHTPSTFLYTWGDEYSRRMPMTTSVFRYVGNIFDGLNYIFVDRPLDRVIPPREEGCGTILCSNPHML